MTSSISDDSTDVVNPGGFTGVLQQYPYGRLYNLYLDPKETHSYLIRKLVYIEVIMRALARHRATFQKWPNRPPQVTARRRPLAQSGREQPRDLRDVGVRELGEDRQRQHLARRRFGLGQRRRALRVHGQRVVRDRVVDLRRDARRFE